MMGSIGVKIGRVRRFVGPHPPFWPLTVAISYEGVIYFKRFTKTRTLCRERMHHNLARTAGNTANAEVAAGHATHADPSQPY
eukprot:5279088-Prymnesium_polylepis.1